MMRCRLRVLWFFFFFFLFSLSVMSIVCRGFFSGINYLIGIKYYFIQNKIHQEKIKHDKFNSVNHDIEDAMIHIHFAPDHLFDVI